MQLVWKNDALRAKRRFLVTLLLNYFFSTFFHRSIGVKPKKCHVDQRSLDNLSIQINVTWKYFWTLYQKTRGKRTKEKLIQKLNSIPSRLHCISGRLNTALQSPGWILMLERKMEWFQIAETRMRDFPAKAINDESFWCLNVPPEFNLVPNIIPP